MHETPRRLHSVTETERLRLSHTMTDLAHIVSIQQIKAIGSGGSLIRDE
jgi:hypothetical protein